MTNDIDHIKYAVYSEGIAGDGVSILKDGHTMFPQDIVKDLNRKSHLEEVFVDMFECLDYLYKNGTFSMNAIKCDDDDFGTDFEELGEMVKVVLKKAKGQTT